jgi:hypothetical protein
MAVEDSRVKHPKTVVQRRVESGEPGGGWNVSGWLPARKKSSKTGLRHRACNAIMPSSEVICRSDESGSLGNMRACVCVASLIGHDLIGEVAHLATVREAAAMTEDNNNITSDDLSGGSVSV